ncbi:MAG: helix-turn-helix domain-containing protein [bacterium]
MAITQEELGRRLRSAREALGMTQEDVALHLQLSRPTIAQVEAGNRAVSSLELDQFARLFGRDIREFLAPEFEDEDALRALFRAQPGFAVSDEILSTLVSWRNKARALTSLEKLLDLPQRLCTATVYDSPSPASRWAAIQQGEHVAVEERARLGLGKAPVSNAPELLESQGVRTALEPLPEDVSGLTLQERGLGLVVVVNETHAPLRHRFSFAHEYAHVLLDRSRGGMVSRIEDRDDLVEIRANAFAASLLMPAEGVREFVRELGKGFGSRQSAEVYDYDDVPPLKVEGRAPPRSQDIQMYDVIQAAEHFGVSRMAMIYRFKNLRFISQPELDSLKQQEETRYTEEMARLLGAKNAFSRDESLSVFRRRFITAALEAYRRSLISQGKFVELGVLVGFTHDELRVLQEAAGVSDDEDEDSRE